MQAFVRKAPSDIPENLLCPLIKDQPLPTLLTELLQENNIPEAALKEDFKAEPKEVQTLYLNHNKRLTKVFLLGLDPSLEFAKATQAFRTFIFKHRKKLPAELHVLLSHFEQESLLVEAAISGILLGRYEIGRFKTQADEKPPFCQADASTHLLVEDVEQATKALHRGMICSETQLEIIDLVNAPANKKTPRVLADWALASAQKYDYKVKVIEKADLEKMGMHALLAVNRGSEDPACLIVMEYQPASKSDDTPTLGLVGKGVTFDTGGVSLKPSANMHFMKSDMGGAAAVLGTMEVLARLQAPVHAVGIIPATDNSIDAFAIKPSDVIDSYSGKSIEIIDTDAEGRLILADGIAYINKHYQPDVLIDLATLTGSCIRTFGYSCGGLFSNNDQLAKHLLEASQKTGERLWQLPIWEEYHDMMKSDVADIKNFSGKPMAGAITAAKFLQFFTEEHPAWAHMDIAGVAIADSEFAGQKSATGYGIRLLLEFAEQGLSKLTINDPS
jgi:leucyl aminopeptidase